jgi:hypothetical protein
MFTLGRDHHFSKVTDERVIEIRELAASGLSCAIIADRSGLDRRTVWHIITGRTHRNVGGPLTFSKPIKKTSRFIGVRLRHGRWEAQLGINGEVVQLGTFGFESDAAIAWNTHVAYLRLPRPLNAIPEDEMWHD